MWPQCTGSKLPPRTPIRIAATILRLRLRQVLRDRGEKVADELAEPRSGDRRDLEVRETPSNGSLTDRIEPDRIADGVALGRDDRPRAGGDVRRKSLELPFDDRDVLLGVPGAGG